MARVSLVDPSRDGIARALSLAFQPAAERERDFEELLRQLDKQPERELERVR